MADLNNTLVKGSLYVIGTLTAGKISGPLEYSIKTADKAGNIISSFDNSAETIIKPESLGLAFGGSGSATVNQAGTSISEVLKSVSMNDTTGAITVTKEKLTNVVIESEIKVPVVEATSVNSTNTNTTNLIANTVSVTDLKTANWTMNQMNNDLVFKYA